MSATFIPFLFYLYFMENRISKGDSHPNARSGQKVKVFVHLGHGFGAATWQRRYSAGLIPGVNEPLPYGYYRAGEDGRWSIEYSEDGEESSAIRLVRRSLQKFIGFDLIHAWRNRRQLLAADIVWTHTEREHLAVSLLKLLLNGRKRPAIIAQSVWLFDLWPKLPRWKKRLYLRLLQQADLITTFSPKNLECARTLLRQKTCRSVMFGIGSKVIRLSPRQSIDGAIKLLALGNDMHRDWNTLIAAFGGMSDYQVRLGSNSARGRLIKGFTNVSLHSATTEQEMIDLYDWADLVVVPLKENSHASGITVVLEATLFGLPVVCSDTGGLRAYFSDEQIGFVSVADPRAMRAAVDEIAINGDLRRNLVSKAQERISSANLTAQGFADQHRKLSQMILFGATTN
jgi:glycosyltransferase involved in cell wall biosynthesis